MDVISTVTKITLGLTVEKLLVELEDNFPVFLPQPSDPHSMIMYKSGQRSVVEWIANRLSDEG